jgi:hypothetical protein
MRQGVRGKRSQGWPGQAGQRVLSLAAPICALALAIGFARPYVGAAAVCPTRSIGVDTSKANDLDGPILGEAYGQVFLAKDTLISAITVWRIAAEATNYTGWHLFITRADSLGVPVPNSILLDGPTVVNPYGDGVHPIPMRFAFDPPFALPQTGRYYFAIQANPCDGFFNMEFDDSNDYADGSVWRNGRTLFNGCHLRNFPEQFPQADMVFTIEFCDLATPALSETWGRVKARYR